MNNKIKIEDTFGYYLEKELKLNIDDIWNWNKNPYHPYELKKRSNKKVWLYCQSHDYHNYNQIGDKIGYEITCADFYNGRRCGYCGNHKTHYKDSIGYNKPQIANMIAIHENNLIFQDTLCIRQHSGKFYFKCSECGNISSSKKMLSNIVRRGFHCEFCGDGFSIPEKFMSNILRQLNIDFLSQISNNTFDWCGVYRYDFYIPSLNMVIETHGGQHYKENYRGKSLANEQQNDDFKKELALQNNIDKYVIIDCRLSTLEWLKNNIIQELAQYIDLSQINWEYVWEQSQCSKCVETWMLWNRGHSVSTIGKELSLSVSVVHKYLCVGVELNKCNYTTEESVKRVGLDNRGANNYKSRDVICLTTKEIFRSMGDAGRKYQIDSRNIYSCCIGYKTWKGKKYKVYSAGKSSNGARLKWKFLNWKHDKKYKVKER